MPAEAGDTIAALRAMRVRIGVACEESAMKVGLAFQRAGMAHTKVVLGTLRRSWRTEPVKGGDGVYGARVGPTTVYARRQELGFMPPLRDSLGRSFPTAYGWPYVRPAYAEAKPLARPIVVRALTEAIGR
jgi:hypothetical protein